MEKKRNEKFKVIQPGISISSKYSTTGTLGLIVFDKKNNYAPCILSNWHVLAKSFIPRSSFRTGKPIYQPGKLFIPTRKQRKTKIVAKLSRHDRNTDSAIARIINRPFILNQFQSDIVISTARIPKKGDIIEKSGARTGITRGKIVSIVGSKVKIKPIEQGNPNNIEISAGGDSGSVWYDPETLEGLVLHNTGEKKSDAIEEFAGGHALIDIIGILDISLTDNS